MSETVRFAPSPTGELHIGNVRTALFNWLEAAGGGRFVLRYDDTDRERSRQEFADQIATDMAWLGITPDEVARQSERLAKYDAAADALRAKGLLYPCFETGEELERKRALQRARGRPPVYDRAALSLTDEDRNALEAKGRRPHWRFKLPEGERTWVDRCRGEVTVPLSTVSDPILIREDGSYLYTLPSVVDDIAFAITLVIRGEDHVTNSGVQIALFEALGGTAPTFAHHNLLTRSDGEPLSKRDNPLSIRALAEAGYEAMAVASLAVLVGTSKPITPHADIAALSAAVTLQDVSRGPAMFDPAELGRLNSALVHELPFEAVESELATFNAASPQFWQTIHGNLGFRSDAKAWAARWHADGAPTYSDDARSHIVDPAFFAAALSALPADVGGEGAFKAFSNELKAATGAKGKSLFMPLRAALTGETHGPELGPWLALIGHDKAAQRLEAAHALATNAAS
ncbi:MAG: glutamate--tRNA ligase [Pseudomonadota bacterium]